MKRQARTSIPERLGRWTGRAWRGYMRREVRVLLWMQAKGMPVPLAKILMWTVKLLLIGTLLYLVFWMALFFVFSVAVVWLTKNVDGNEQPQWGLGDSTDHKQSIFYHPASYNDDPDPRFEDD